MNLDAAFPLSKLRPPEDREAQIDGGGIECVDIPFQIKDIDLSLLPGLRDKIICVLLEDSIISILIGIRKICLGDIPAHSEVIALVAVSVKNCYQIAQA